MGAAYSLDVGSLTTTYCGVAGCGIAFAIPTSMESDRRRDGKSFYCPNGHYIAYGNSENERLRRELEQRQSQLVQRQKQLEWAEQATRKARDQRDAAEKSARSLKGSRTRLKNRFAKGLCPHCSATFPDLAKHVRAMHSEQPAAQPPLEVEKP